MEMKSGEPTTSNNNATCDNEWGTIQQTKKKKKKKPNRIFIFSTIDFFKCSLHTHTNYYLFLLTFSPNGKHFSEATLLINETEIGYRPLDKLIYNHYFAICWPNLLGANWSSFLVFIVYGSLFFWAVESIFGTVKCVGAHAHQIK